MRILVTGGSGTLGYNIIARLVADPRHTRHRPCPQPGLHVVLPFKDKVQFIEHELSDAIHTAQIFERANPDVIVHCAASGLRPPRASWFDLMHFNVESTMRLFQMNCRFDHHSRFIYISTGLVYREQGRPLTEDDPIETLHPYGASKAAGRCHAAGRRGRIQTPAHHHPSLRIHRPTRRRTPPLPPNPRRSRTPPNPGPHRRNPDTRLLRCQRHRQTRSSAASRRSREPLSRNTISAADELCPSRTSSWRSATSSTSRLT